MGTISAIRSSEMGPGPLGMAETRPRAEAPYRIASCASSMLAIQQIFTRGMDEGLMEVGVIVVPPFASMPGEWIFVSSRFRDGQSTNTIETLSWRTDPYR